MTTLALFLSGIGGCVVYSDDVGYTTGGYTTVVTNAPPYVIDSAAWVYFDTYYGDDIWAFEAWVDDPNGYGDILGVWADVYDGNSTVPIESFELYPTDDPSYWYSEWFGSTSRLDPFWPNYQVDFVVYDVYEDFGYDTVYAESY
jgi:hypothetical protein